MIDELAGTLPAILRRARELGFLGPPPVETHIAHTAAFAAAIVEANDGADPGPVRALDLGSGGGVPGLILALHWPRSTWTLLDAGERRTAFLTEAVSELGLVGRVAVVRARAEEAGHVPVHRCAYDIVTARAFGPPAVTAECGAPFLRVGGMLVVSEPGGSDAATRWPIDGLEEVGLAVGHRRTGPTIQVLRQASPCPEQYARHVGVPSKRPLWP